MDAIDYVSVEDFDVQLADLKAEDTCGIIQHLSVAEKAAPTILNGTTYGENARFLVATVISRGTKQSNANFINVIMLVDLGSLYVFLITKTWNALGVKLEDLPNDQTCVKINGVQVLAHISLNHFQDIYVLGASFLKNCKLTVDYPEQNVEIQTRLD